MITFVDYPFVVVLICHVRPPWFFGVVYVVGAVIVSVFGVVGSITVAAIGVGICVVLGIGAGMAPFRLHYF